MLFAFEKYEGVVIKNNLKWWSYDTKSKILTTYSQEPIWDIAESLERDYGQDIWHRFIGLPGSIGGAVYGNAGCFGLEAENNFVSATVVDMSTWEIENLSKKQMNFSYRNSILKEKKAKYFIISIEFDLSKKIEKYHSDVDNIYFREHQQPKGNSCGSFFKNPRGLVLDDGSIVVDTSKINLLRSEGKSNYKNLSAGYLIEQVWFKWKKIGWAYFSEKHANFLMHDEKGSYKDMLELMALAQSKVKAKFEIELVNEVQIIYSK